MVFILELNPFGIIIPSIVTNIASYSETNFVSYDYESEITPRSNSPGE